MNINTKNLNQIAEANDLNIIPKEVLSEKVIQFGTGVLLRGLPDYYINQANLSGDFQGSVVVVKSTDQGDLKSFEEQDYIYTLLTEGIENGNIVQHKEIITCISRILTTKNHWNQLLKTIENPNIEFIISNTTESGIVEIDQESIDNPSSFPGRVTALLYHRFIHFQGTEESGLIILPTELIDNNADELKRIVLDIATKNKLPEGFNNWINKANHFCNTLVDRIVPGKTDDTSWNYKDELAVAVEPYNLWAIEVKDMRIMDRIGFAKANKGIKLTDSIHNIKELKLRLLNASHTLLCPLAILAHHEYVKNSLELEIFEKWIKELMKTEITQHLLNNKIESNEIVEFSSFIIDRFKNPFINHKWINIAQNSTNKWKQRVVPILLTWNALNKDSSRYIALSMAAYLKCNELFELEYFPIDDRIKQSIEMKQTIHDILNREDVWSYKLGDNISFSNLVTHFYNELNTKSILQIIN